MCDYATFFFRPGMEESLSLPHFFTKYQLLISYATVLLSSTQAWNVPPDVKIFSLPPGLCGFPQASQLLPHSLSTVTRD